MRIGVVEVVATPTDRPFPQRTVPRGLRIARRMGSSAARGVDEAGTLGPEAPSMPEAASLPVDAVLERLIGKAAPALT